VKLLSGEMTSDFTVIHLSSHVCVHHLGSLRPEKVVVVQINVGTCVRTYYPVYTCTPDESLKLKLHESRYLGPDPVCNWEYMLEE
jgi:hypothetical protein